MQICLTPLCEQRYFYYNVYKKFVIILLFVLSINKKIYMQKQADSFMSSELDKSVQKKKEKKRKQAANPHSGEDMT